MSSETNDGTNLDDGDRNPNTLLEGNPDDPLTKYILTLPSFKMSEIGAASTTMEKSGSVDQQRKETLSFPGSTDCRDGISNGTKLWSMNKDEIRGRKRKRGIEDSEYLLKKICPILDALGKAMQLKVDKPMDFILDYVEFQGSKDSVASDGTKLRLVIEGDTRDRMQGIEDPEYVLKKICPIVEAIGKAMEVMPDDALEFVEEFVKPSFDGNKKL